MFWSKVKREKKIGNPLKSGFNFGLTSAVITTTGLMIGLTAGTGSKLAVLGGILTIAIADAFSDALGIHTSEEAEGDASIEIWTATITAFLAKFITTASFVIPFIIFNLGRAVVVSIIWGTLLLAIFSYSMAKSEKKNPFYIITEHILIAAIVIAITHYAGEYIGSRLR